MGNISELYLRKFPLKVKQYNKPMQLPAYFAPLIGDKKRVHIAEIGAGPVNTIGDSWPGVDVLIDASDVLAKEYWELWSQIEGTPRIPVLYQDMEQLTYTSGFFDIVHCVNALDHTANPWGAILELKRVCKKDGYVYLRHSPMQMKRFGGHHYWNIYMEDGQVIFRNKEEWFFLGSEFESYEDEEGLIVSIWKKT